MFFLIGLSDTAAHLCSPGGFSGLLCAAMGAFALGKRQDTAAPVLVSLALLAVSIIPPRANIRKEQPAAARFIFIPIATKRPVVRREITSGRDRRDMTPPKPAQGRLTPPLIIGCKNPLPWGADTQAILSAAPGDRFTAAAAAIASKEPPVFSGCPPTLRFTPRRFPFPPRRLDASPG